MAKTAGVALRLWKIIFEPVVEDEAGLRRYVASVTLFAWVVALGSDIANESFFFVSWADSFREFGITTAVVLVIAVPIARTMGRAHLALRLARLEAERLSRTDPLTGLANRRAFYEAAARAPNASLALVIADIDRFKRINDRYGHSAGDEVIKGVARLMLAELGELGLVARVGGEEFALLTRDHPAKTVRGRLERFRRRVAAEPAMVGGRRLHATISIGCALSGAPDFEQLYAAADKALYLAKAAGRDRIVDGDEVANLAGEAAAAVGESESAPRAQAG